MAPPAAGSTKSHTGAGTDEIDDSTHLDANARFQNRQRITFLLPGFALQVSGFGALEPERGSGRDSTN
jgi:hypothetical protein